MAKSGKSFPFQRLQQSVAAKSAITGPIRKDLSTLTVDVVNMPPPTRTYYAQECWGEFENGIVDIFFAQKKRTGGPLRSLVCIHMAPMYVNNWLRSIDDMHSPSVAEIVEMVNIKTEKINPIPDEADQTFESSANVVRTGVSALDVTLDFIKVTPFEIAGIKHGNPAKGEPQIRVDIRTSLFLGLIENLKEMSQTFPPNIQGSKEA